MLRMIATIQSNTPQTEPAIMYPVCEIELPCPARKVYSIILLDFGARNNKTRFYNDNRKTMIALSRNSF